MDYKVGDIVETKKKHPCAIINGKLQELESTLN